MESLRETAARFDGRAGDYDAYRPSYPQHVIALILQGFEHPVVADVGAGTGISSRLLAAAGAYVYAIEPNEEMRASMGTAPALHAVAGTAECTGLPDSSVDVVASFQAYHWFDPERFFDEVLRVLRAPGRVAAVWNHRDLSQPFAARYEAIVEKHGEQVRDIDRARRSCGISQLMNARGFSNVRFEQYATHVALTWSSLTGFMRSCSYLPAAGPKADAMFEELRPVFDAALARNEARFTWLTQVWLADRQ